MKAIKHIGFSWWNGCRYETYFLFDRWIVNIGGKFPWIHGDLGLPF